MQRVLRELNRFLNPYLFCLYSLLMLFGLPSIAYPDALVINRAASATTIAEFFVEADSVTLKLEIGEADINAFRNLLPDDIYEKLGNPPRGWAERIAAFSHEDMPVRFDDGPPVSGTLISMNPQPRLERDPITGEILANNSDNPEFIIQVEMRYPIKNRPATITFSPPLSEGKFSLANIGFVVYHMGLPVNDFRYLSSVEMLNLNWDDPWYSVFENRNLQRKYRHPISTFIYAENYEVRKEIIIRPMDLQHWVDLDLENKSMISADQFESVKTTAANYLMARDPILVDGNSIEPKLESVHFIQRTLRQTAILDTPTDLDINSATLGIIISYPVNALPDEVTMEWDLFNENIQTIYASSADEAGGLPYFLSPDDHVLVWTNYLTNPSIPKMVEIVLPDTTRRVALSLVSMGAFILLLFSLFGMMLVKKKTRLLGALSLVAVVAMIVGWPFAKQDVPLPGMSPPDVTTQQASEVLYGLLYNVYRAFDRNDEDYIYDNLALSIEGDMLSEVYLQTRKSMILENQGGIKIKVKDVSIEDLALTGMSEDGGFSASVQWTASGSVGHWGHIHQRTNLYKALFKVQPIEGAWKITYMDLQEETRVNPA